MGYDTYDRKNTQYLIIQSCNIQVSY